MKGDVHDDMSRTTGPYTEEDEEEEEDEEDEEETLIASALQKGVAAYLGT